MVLDSFSSLEVREAAIAPGIFLVPYRLAGGTFSLLTVCPSVRQSVILSVFLSHFSFPDFSLPSFEILT